MVKLTLKAARVNAGLTQAEAAESIGINPATLLNWEKGKTFPNQKNIVRLCQVYHIPYECFIFLPSDPVKPEYNCSE